MFSRNLTRSSVLLNSKLPLTLSQAHITVTKLAATQATTHMQAKRTHLHTSNSNHRSSVGIAGDAEAITLLATKLKQDPTFGQKLSMKLDENTRKALQESLEAEPQKDDGSAASTMPPITRAQYIKLALRTGAPFMVFGFCDNFFMIIAGEALDHTLGTTIGLSTMAAAGFGNMFSDMIGTGFSGLIQSFADKLRLPQPNLTREQVAHPKVRLVNTVSCIIGISTGCLIGMFPLLLY
eukprot:comp19819_c0_seq1/m.23825 comp19819_c0_seq1/g.23825  ORF comp19819_c0_seq1/g.23825 comp19819_c0_seq1/m.23825 type:complete len:237 (-) comp19819_c0_seq1:534-1244(-)